MSTDKKKIEYPKFLYDKDGKSVLVKSEEEHKALKGEYKESPAAFKSKEQVK